MRCDQGHGLALHCDQAHAQLGTGPGTPWKRGSPCFGVGALPEWAPVHGAGRRALGSVVRPCEPVSTVRGACRCGPTEAVSQGFWLARDAPIRGNGEIIFPPSLPKRLLPSSIPRNSDNTPSPAGQPCPHPAAVWAAPVNHDRSQSAPAVHRRFMVRVDHPGEAHCPALPAMVFPYLGGHRGAVARGAALFCHDRPAK